ncbi:MAG: hypothetical protein WA254_16995 [Candidatus Sulfotelmatobacter sp.]
MKDHSDFYFSSWKSATSMLGVGLLSSTMALETGVLLVSPEIELRIHAMIHTSNHAPAPVEPTANSPISVSGNVTAGTTTYASMGLTFDSAVDLWTSLGKRG